MCDVRPFEFDEACALKWREDNPRVADQVHTGDASSEEDLERAVADAGGAPFDVIIDDASHINWHQIKTLDRMLPHLAAGGLYFVEDISSSCHGWSANMGQYRGENVGGTADCVTTAHGNETILQHVFEYQKHLVGTRGGKEDMPKRRSKKGKAVKGIGLEPEAEGVEPKAGFLKGVSRVEIHFNMAVLSKEVETA